jgi:hypothetical protein
LNRATWKSIERWWAAALGGKRIPVSGRHNGAEGDIEHPLLGLEVKAGKVLSTRLQEALKQAERAAGKTKTPLVCIEHSRPRDPRGNLRVVMMRLEDWIAWHGPNE